jgi:O-antigen ligase
MEKVRRKTNLRATRRIPRPETAGLIVFALLVVAAPIAFGAVDRIVQIGVAALLAIGVLIFPPAVQAPGRRANAFIIAIIALWLFKEFAPAALFGAADWRRTLTESLDLVLPRTHHPEPVRALDAMLAGIVGFVWFIWVRMLALDHDRRTVMVWIMFCAAAVVAAVSFATRGMDDRAIYGLRYTPGWVGFGPFPNRNHTACLLAMGIVLGAGCVGWAGERRRTPLIVIALILAGLTLAALLATQSRGGIVVLVVGIAMFFVLSSMKFRSGRAIGVAVSAVLMMAALGLAFGAEAIGRFTSREAGEVSTHLRVLVWKDALQMWKDAPLFGHGLASFGGIFPMYQTVQVGSAIVLHPESSWLLWLVEFGVIPLGIVLVASAIFLVPRVAIVYSANRNIFIRAGALAAAATLLVHAVFDVPAHRWGTAGFALAALAIGCASSGTRGLLPATRKAALVPLGIASFWALPFFIDWPAWSPLSLARLIAREQATPYVTVGELEQAGKYFPLNPFVHQAIGLHLLEAPAEARSADWQRHFRIANRLLPGSWEIAAEQARAAASVSPGFTLHYWQVAIERGGHRADEIFNMAMSDTARWPAAAETWRQYAETHPVLLLTFAQSGDPAAAKPVFEQWWRVRGSAADDLTEQEIASFYQLLPRLGTPAQLDEWRARRTQLRQRDFKIWAGIYHGWVADESAWKVLASEMPEPEFTPVPPRTDPLRLESIWRLEQKNFVNARDLGSVRAAKGDLAGMTEIVLTVARRTDSPEWFVRKGAHLLAAQGRFREAAELCLAHRPDAAGTP